MIFIKDIEELLIEINCKSIKELANRVNYNSHSILNMVRTKKCTRRMALRICYYLNMPLEKLFKEEE